MVEPYGLLLGQLQNLARTFSKLVEAIHMSPCPVQRAIQPQRTCLRLREANSVIDNLRDLPPGGIAARPEFQATAPTGIARDYTVLVSRFYVSVESVARGNIPESRLGGRFQRPVAGE